MRLCGLMNAVKLAEEKGSWPSRTNPDRQTNLDKIKVYTLGPLAAIVSGTALAGKMFAEDERKRREMIAMYRGMVDNARQ